MSDQPKRFVFTRPMAIMSGVVTVLVLAAVVFLISALGGARSGPSNTAKSEATRYVAQANDALASGDATKAAELAKKAQELDPTSASALAVAKKATDAQKKATGSGTSGSKPGSTGSKGSGGSTNPGSGGSTTPGSGGTATVDESDFDEPVGDALTLLPTTFEGYSFGTAMKTEGEAQVSATAVSAKVPAQQIIWTVHEMKSKASAEDFISKTSKALYAENGSTTTVDEASAYLGTDGTRYATSTYVRGIYVFEVLISVEGDPSQQLGLATSAAKAFADSAK
ncbi:MAG TPA: hypothetical protein VFG89_04765 [Coriobacteriia bacterium]|nr:hypothetical protein [Coriobacteriia bacterium]